MRLRLLLAGLVFLAGCAPQQPNRTITVFAAASLTGAFDAIGQEFTREYPDVAVRFSFAGSQSLVAQVQQGAPADVLATADETSMAKVSEARDPKVFARNRLAIIAPLDQPVPPLKALGRPGLRLVLGGPTVPVGRAARKALAIAEVDVHPVSEEPDVKSVVAKVALGEGDAGIVYATDLADGDETVHGTVLPPIVTSLPIASLVTSDDAKAFVDLVLAPEGQQILARFGFAPP
jgi:molybdate transport system substrate-binding protein